MNDLERQRRAALEHSGERFFFRAEFDLPALVHRQNEIEAGDGYVEERSDPLLELVRMRSAFLRALVAWMSVVALVVMGSWLA